MHEVRECHDELDGQPVRWFEAPVAGGGPPILYVHGVPVSGRLWRPFLERTGGIAPDLPGFGRSGKRADLPYDIAFYGDWLERFAAARGLDELRLVVHDWGAGVGLPWATRRPERIRRLAIVDGVPVLPGYRWHRIARAWRTPLLGELVVGGMGPRTGRRLAAMNPEVAEVMAEGWDQGTQRAILRLYRSADPDVLARAGERLGELRCPALVRWGARDQFIPARFAQAYADALGGPVDVRVVEGARHWAWLDRPEVLDDVSQFIAA